jgi:hypothetical protein
MGMGGYEVALDIEHIVDGGVSEEKFVCRSCALEALHLKLSSAGRLM